MLRSNALDRLELLDAILDPPLVRVYDAQIYSRLNVVGLHLQRLGVVPLSARQLILLLIKPPEIEQRVRLVRLYLENLLQRRARLHQLVLPRQDVSQIVISLRIRRPRIYRLLIRAFGRPPVLLLEID